jgi:antitoxin CptB
MVDAEALNRLKWRSRRGLLENDLFVERFFRRHAETLTERNATGLQALMELADPDLLDLFLARQEPQDALDCEAVHEVLRLIRSGSMTERQ